MFHRQAIDEAMVDRDLVFLLQRAGSSSHAVMSGAQDIERVNRGGIDIDLSP